MGWIAFAKRQGTREKRIEEVVKVQSRILNPNTCDRIQKICLTQFNYAICRL
ncbi:YdeI/OmpD-associated family protein [Sphingobacterium sp. KU25419]|nr:YdeI/OmpD-associated family protein [Sphingobacterium sp. KU25419]